MKVLYSALALAAFALTSCKGELEPQESSVVSESTDATTINPAATTLQPNVNPAQATTQQTIAQGVNPPHGQPGHQCEVAVGAPLTKTTTTQANQITQTQQVTPQMMNAAKAPTQQPVKTAPGMNPPHGQAGHRCDVAVGAPLNSAPKASSANITPGAGSTATFSSDGKITPGSGTTITTTNNNSAPPAILKAPAETATSTNPPHGEPGHVCAQ